MKKKLKPFLIALVILVIIGYAGGSALAYFLDGQYNEITEAIRSDWSFIGAALGVVLAIV